ncbi:MAG: transglutaminase domain-containing protein, partial [Deltaproteobacteria bacterium]|nr:transglutaminase domain-containing protein [Deltaproteobacteria bacterium]
ERLKFEISGIQNTRVRLDGGRQIFRNNVLTIDKESLANLAHDLDGKNLGAFEKIYLQPTAFIQSDHQNIQTLAQKIVAGQMTPLDKVQALVDWVYQNIDKRPVLSLPDALSTLENRVGDCNEHAVLFAALARATGIGFTIMPGTWCIWAAG